MLLKKIIKKLKALFGETKRDGGGIDDIPKPPGAPDDQRIFLRASGFGDDGKLQNLERPTSYAFPLPRGPLSNQGRPITFETATRFIQEFLRDDDIDGEDVAAITFDKDVLLLLLAQSQCEGIRFYFGKFPKSEDMTLVLVGVDKDNNDLGANRDGDKGRRSLFSAKSAKDDKEEAEDQASYAKARMAKGGDDDAEPTLLFEIGGHLKVDEL